MVSKWAKRFIQMAELVGSWSKDPSTQVGAVITKNNRIVSVGFNGYPHGISDSAEVDERETKYLKTLHAEENAILFAKRDLDGCEIWVTHFPCPNCAAKIIQTGISVVHCPQQTEDFLSRWGEKISLSQDMFEQAGVHVDWLPLEQLD
ncbi:MULTISPECIES: cytidine/deoxycytidylate deaminase family protein [Vibrio]|jgi:dCMP deaminase|uniref:dCMP deaminase family protein n=2 Tax=Vibrio TaxID=662 RepID=A0ABW7IGD0_9VIBR|nr:MULTISPECIES: cytidine/deoxycytidylate deaminase family protein [Vibrio]KFA98960.1 cell division protein DedD [Vibrio sp. ER1A]MCG9656371.1 cytidine/deoxycytidylate deaminase family protein [Vibrio mediterranei]MCG9662093.1 cytidine/deoxycytidylate deaminase family protein [Vibrio mediterranei]MCG9787515.1 cytidine/deoxycytidylate deaminase family protein [Vibrio mediterranei]MCY9872800.1 cytidine/deoxycytidylate deaminase family protein [Vibrio barjaei]